MYHPLRNQLEKLEAAKASLLVCLSLLSLIWSFVVLLDQFLLPYWALLSLTGPCWALLDLTGPYWALLSLTGPYWTLLGHTVPYWKLYFICMYITTYWAAFAASQPKMMLCWQVA